MVFGLFSKEKGLQKTIDRATNKLAQSIDRQAALDQLAKESTDEAIFGLCKRFSVTSTKAVEDEQEKHWVVQTLIGKGAAVLPGVIRYMKSADHLAFPLQVVAKVADRDKLLSIVDDLFASEQPGYVRMPDRRIDLLRWFAEWRGGTDDEVLSRLTPYVGDFDENSRFAAIEGMAGRDAAKLAPPLILALLRPEEESGRIKRTIVEVLEKAQAPLGDRADAVAAAISAAGPVGYDFKVDGGLIKRR